MDNRNKIVVILAKTSTGRVNETRHTFSSDNGIKIGLCMQTTYIIIQIIQKF